MTESVPSPQETPVAAKNKQRLVSPFMVDLIGVGSAIAASTVTAWSLIEAKAYKNLSSLGIWNDIKPERIARGREVLKNVERGSLNATQAFKQIDDLIEVGEQGARERLNKIGVRNVVDRWKLLRRHQRAETIISTIAVGGIALGSVLLLTHEMFTKKDREDLANKGTDAAVAPSESTGIQR